MYDIQVWSDGEHVCWDAVRQSESLKRAVDHCGASGCCLVMERYT